MQKVTVMSSISAISSTLVKRTIPLCSLSKTSTSYNSSTTTPLLLSFKNPMFPSRPQVLVHARLSGSPDEYPSRSPPEFSPPAPGFDRPSVPPEVPGISTSPEVDIPTPPEVSPYPPLEPGPDSPVPPLKPPPVPDGPPPVPDGPPPFPDNPIPGPDRQPPQPPDITPPPRPGPEIIPPPTPPPPSGPGGPIIV